MPLLLLDAALNLVFPPLCRSCESVLSGDPQEILCSACRSRLRLIPDPRCERCGAPTENGNTLKRDKFHLSSQCPTVSLHFESARSAVEYAPPFRELILQFKFRGSERAAPILIEWFLKGAARDYLESDFDCVVPVPLHWWRRFQREFNQAEVLGTALAEEWSVPILDKALKRRRATVAQSKLPGKWRAENITKAFGPGTESVAGRRVLLVDDVMTTGATLSECAGVLLKAGAASVKAYTLARRL